MTTTNVRFQLRRDLSTNWTGAAANPVLLSGEPGYETDTNILRIGDGTSQWSSLPAISGGGGGGGVTLPEGTSIGNYLSYTGSTWVTGGEGDVVLGGHDGNNVPPSNGGGKSTVIGKNAQGVAFDTVVGWNANTLGANNSNNVVIGQNCASITNIGGDVAIGGNARTFGSSVAIGSSALTKDNRANLEIPSNDVAIGASAATDGNAVAIGYSANSSNNGVAIGGDAIASLNAVGIGRNVRSSIGSTVIGSGNNVSNTQNSIVIASSGYQPPSIASNNTNVIILDAGVSPDRVIIPSNVLDQSRNYAFYVNPIRIVMNPAADPASPLYVGPLAEYTLWYNPVTKEVCCHSNIPPK